MKENIIIQISDNKLIAICRGVPSRNIISVADALYAGGIRIMELTYDMKKDIDDNEVAHGIELIRNKYSGRMIVGAGSVITEDQVLLTRSAGGQLIISPNTKESIIKLTNKCDMVSIPGAYTPTEIAHAYQCGADFVKLFPISLLTPEQVKAIKAPLSAVKMLAVGGINEDNIKQYLNAGICGFGIGSNLVNASIVSSGDYDKLKSKAERFVSVLEQGRKNEVYYS